jgi:hypothetical protein
MTRENETWVIEVGDVVIRKRAEHGVARLSQVDRLIYCLWVADYGMRNAGDLTTATDLYAQFQEEGLLLASALRLANARAAFEMPIAILEKQYFERFDAICDEIRNVACGIAGTGQ